MTGGIKDHVRPLGRRLCRSAIRDPARHPTPWNYVAGAGEWRFQPNKGTKV